MGTKISIFVIVNILAFNSLGQFELGYSFGANATISLVEKQTQTTEGFKGLFIPNTWNNQFYLNYHKNKTGIRFLFENGALGPTWGVKSRADKYPFSNEPNTSTYINLSANSRFKGRSRHNSNLLKYSIQINYCFSDFLNTRNSFDFGVGYLFTRSESNTSNFGSGGYIDSLGFVESGFIMDNYTTLKTRNFYLTLGYTFSKQISPRLNLNAQIMYNQGLSKMIRWHGYRVYNEPLIGYFEFEENWAFTRLSYCTFTIGLSYRFKVKNGK